HRQHPQTPARRTIRSPRRLSSTARRSSGGTSAHAKNNWQNDCLTLISHLAVEGYLQRTGWDEMVEIRDGSELHKGRITPRLRWPCQRTSVREAKACGPGRGRGARATGCRGRLPFMDIRLSL